MTAPRPGRLPLASVVLVETGVAVALLVVAIDRSLLPVGGVLLAATLPVALLRHRGRWLVEWLTVALRYRCRVRERIAESDAAGGDLTGGDLTGEGLRVLRLVAGDVVATTRHDHDGRAVGLLGQEGVWIAVLAPDTAAVAPVAGSADRPALPWPALADALHDRGVVLDALTALWHRPPRPPGPVPAAEAYGELVDPLAGAGTHRACLVVRFDPTRCPDAVAVRGGGTPGSHRALLGALARLRRVLDDHGLPTRPLDVDEIVDAAVTTGLAGLGAAPTASERWDAVLTAGDDAETGHAVFALLGGPADPSHPADPADPADPDGGPAPPDPFAVVWSVPDAATTLAVALAPGPGGPDPDRDGPAAATVSLRCLVRLAAPTPARLAAAGAALARDATDAGLVVRRLDGDHAAGLAATLPVPSPPTPRTRDGTGVSAVPAPWRPVPAEGLAGLGPPLAERAIVLGAGIGAGTGDATGDAVMLALVRDRPARVVVLGGLSLAREVALRAAGTGVSVVVGSGRPAAWEAVRLAATTAGAPPHDGAGELVVHDHGLSPRGPDTPPAPRRTTLVVLPSLTPAVTDLADDADLVLLTRMPPHEAELAGRLWRLDAGMVEELRTLPDHGLVALGPQLWRRVDRVSVPREAAILGPVRLGD